MHALSIFGGAAIFKLELDLKNHLQNPNQRLHCRYRQPWRIAFVPLWKDRTLLLGLPACVYPYLDFLMLAWADCDCAVPRSDYLAVPWEYQYLLLWLPTLEPA
jgi:hypothetical protein